MSGVISGVIASIGGGGVVSPPVITGTTGSWDSFSGASYSGFTSDGNRAIYGYKYFSMSDSLTDGGGGAIGFTVSGTGLTYEWQYLSYYGFNSGACGPQPAAGYLSLMYGTTYPYEDYFSGSASATLTFNTVYGYHPNIDGSRGVDGYWRLKISNSAGTIYSPWTETVKRWGEYHYDCNCNCPCSTTDCYCSCDCDENYENCTGCCSQCCDCTENCDICIGYSDYSYGDYGNWCA